MTWLLQLLRALFVLAPRELVVALARAVVLLLNLLLVLLLWLWQLLLAAIKGKGLFQEEQEEPCGRLPEAVIRRPDPAIYSQRLLLSQGLPVTWNNPDIWSPQPRIPTPSSPTPTIYRRTPTTSSPSGSTTPAPTRRWACGYGSSTGPGASTAQCDTGPDRRRRQRDRPLRQCRPPGQHRDDLRLAHPSHRPRTGSWALLP